MNRVIILSTLLLAACKPTYSDIIAACSKSGGAVVRVYGDSYSDYRCVKLEIVK